MNASLSQDRLRVATLLLLLSCTASAFLAPTSPALVVPSSPSSSRHTFSSIEKRNIVHHVKAQGNAVGPIKSIRPSSSALASAPLPLPKLAVMGAGVAKFYKAFPLIAGFLTTSTKACFADSMAQYRDASTTKFDAKRNLAMVLYSGLVLGILCEIMYNRLFPMLFGAATVERSVTRAIKMTLFDGFINAPLIWLPPAYIAKALVFRYPKREGIQKYVTDVKENGLLKKYWSVWLPMSMINFLFVPAHFRIAFLAGVSFFWMIILSMISNNA